MNSTKFRELERKALKIKRKFYYKIFLVLIGVGGFLFFNGINFDYFNKPIEIRDGFEAKEATKELEVEKRDYETFNKSKVKNFQKNTQKVKIKSVKKVEENLVQAKKNIEYDTIKLKPTFNLDVYFQKELKAETKQVKKAQKKKKVEVEKPKKKALFKVREIDSEDALLEKFKSTNSFESALNLAEFYFNNKNFHKSIYWAKKASKLQPKDEKSWLIYAKSKRRLGDKIAAIKALELYRAYFKSNKIDLLLQKLKEER